MDKKLNPICEFEEDILERRKFSEMLLERIISLKNNESSYVIGVYGDWGSGKSSIINLMLKCLEDKNWEDFKTRNNMETIETESYTAKDYLKSFKMLEKPLEFFYDPPTRKKSDKPTIIQFSPWNYSKEDSLISNFFRQLSSVIIESNVEKSLNIVPVLKRYSELIGFATPYALPFVELLNFYESEDDTLNSEDTYKIKNELIKKLETLKNKIIVIIDDIDRLSKEEIVEVFRLVKSVADFPNIVYVLSFDLDIIAKALSDIQGPLNNTYNITGNIDGSTSESNIRKSHYGNIDLNVANNISVSIGYKYIEKIVQMPFEIPRVDKNCLYDELNKGIFKITNKNPIEIEGYYELHQKGFKSFFKNLRDVYRYLNVLKFNWSKIEDSVDFLDYLGILTINVFAPNLYNVISEEKYDLTTIEITGRLSKIFKDPKTGFLSEHYNLIEYLFPKLKYEKNSGSEHTWSGDYKKESTNWEDKKRICTFKFFDNYFARNNDDTYIIEEINQLIDIKFNKIVFKNRLSLMVDRKDFKKYLFEIQKLSDIPYENLKFLILSILELESQIQSEDYLDILPLISRSLKQHILKLDDKQKSELYNIFIESDHGLAIITYMAFRSDVFENKIHFKNKIINKIMKVIEDGENLGEDERKEYIIYEFCMNHNNAEQFLINTAIKSGIVSRPFEHILKFIYDNFIIYSKKPSKEAFFSNNIMNYSDEKSFSKILAYQKKTLNSTSKSKKSLDKIEEITMRLLSEMYDNAKLK